MEDNTVTVEVSGDAYKALVALMALWPTEDISSVVAECIIGRAHINGAHFTRTPPEDVAA
jgi:hypothetical protein